MFIEFLLALDNKHQQVSFIIAKKTKIKTKKIPPPQKTPKTTPKLSNENLAEQNGLQNMV